MVPHFLVASRFQKVGQHVEGEGAAWANENFTRLQLEIIDCSNQSALPEGFKWRIVHEPMKARYANPTEYKSIVAPVRQEEWKHYSTDFKLNSKTKGTVTQCQFIEKVGVKGSSRRVIFNVHHSEARTLFHFLECRLHV